MEWGAGRVLNSQTVIVFKKQTTGQIVRPSIVESIVSVYNNLRLVNYR